MLTAHELDHLAAMDAAREKLIRRGAKSDASARYRICHVIALQICRRWEAAGYTTVRLVDGLPRPERPHAAAWQGAGRFKTCAACGRTCYDRTVFTTCPGPGAFNLVMQALENGVPFGLGVDGLPTAGVACRPSGRREERQAA